MKRFLFNIMVFALIVNPVNAQTDTFEVNKLNENDQRSGQWEFYYNDGALKETGEYIDGQKSGIWKTYYEDGTIKHEITYQNGLAKGPARFYYRDGTLWEEGFWNETHWKGEYSLYHANGQKFYEWQYNESGKRTGEQKYFHANGQLQYSGEWENGNIEGEVEVYDEAGQLLETREYSKGTFDKSTVVTLKPVNEDEDPDRKILPFYGTGHYTLQSIDGLVIKEGYFRDGVLQDGKHFIYNDKDSLIKVKIMENGKYLD